MTVTVPPGIDPQRWERAPWHAKQKLIDAQNRAARPQPIVYVDPDPDGAPDYLEFSVAAVEQMLDSGNSPTYIADYFGLSIGGIEARMRRLDRRDLAGPFSRARTQKRKKPCVDCGVAVSHANHRCLSCARRKGANGRRVAS